MAVSPSLFCDTCGASNQPRAAYCRACGHPLQSTQPTAYNSATGRLLTNVLLKQRYRILALIAKGGMGAVYKAEDIQLGNRLVAVKEMSQSGLSAQEAQNAANAFKQEAILLASLQHPHLPSIFEHFEEHGRWYLVMSFIQGNTLADYLSQTKAGKLPLDETLSIGLQLCDVLGYLHTQQSPIIFRDLKPANIMRTTSGHLYLIDFGIARHFKPGQARDTAYYGSMGYAPPEQFGRAQTTPRSDIYSLGALLYQLVSGYDPTSSPFRFPPLQSLVPTAPSDLVTILTQILELDEAKRPTNVLEVKQKLQTITAPLVTLSPPPLAPTVAAPSPNPSVPVTPPPSVGATPAPTPVQPLAPTQIATPSPSSVGQFGSSQSSIMLNQAQQASASSPSKRNKSSGQIAPTQAATTTAPQKNKVLRYLFPLFTGIPGGILPFLLSFVLASLSTSWNWNWYLVSLFIPLGVISAAAGFITGKYTMRHVIGLFTGLVIATSRIVINTFSTRYFIWIFIICGLCSWLAAWLATRKHSH